MRYGSVCSGVEAATLAWAPLGWDCAWVSEIEPFPCAVLDHHWPDIPNLGDMTDETFIERVAASGSIQCLVGGTPCQSFSIAGLRGGLGDDRGNLALRFCQVALHLQPPWIVWENVPGVLSSNGGRDFGAILGALVECGYGFAYRVLDAQYFGVPQRRRRVFVVGHLGDWRPAAAVLFERESLQRDITPRREAREGPAPAVTGGPPYSRTGNERVEAEAIVPVMAVADAGASTGHSSPSIDSTVQLNPDLSPTIDSRCADGPRRNQGGVLVAGTAADHETYVPIWRETDQANAPHFIDQAGTLNANEGQRGGIVAIAENQQGEFRTSEVVPNINSGGGKPGQGYAAIMGFYENEGSHNAPHLDNIAPSRPNAGGNNAVASDMQVRRLTPVECERLQGMPDNHTRIPWRNKPAEDCPDGPRYKAIGNSMAVPVMRWLGERVAMVDALLEGIANNR